MLIFIVAYQAARHLESVLDRIPRELIDNPDIAILVIDDGSGDASAAIAAAWAEEHHAENVSVLRNPVNQGYGGNQKIGYRLAIETGFDFVVLLHGDGQYAPELLPQFIDTWRQSAADVVLGLANDRPGIGATGPDAAVQADRKSRADDVSESGDGSRHL